MSRPVEQEGRARGAWLPVPKAAMRHPALEQCEFSQATGERVHFLVHISPGQLTAGLDCDGFLEFS